MTLSEWKNTMREFIDGIESELHPSAAVKTKTVFNAFRRRLNEKSIARRRKHFEEELEAFFQSEPILRVAAERSLQKKIRPAVEEAIVLLERAEALLTKAGTKKRASGSSVLSDRTLFRRQKS